MKLCFWTLEQMQPADIQSKKLARGQMLCTCAALVFVFHLACFWRDFSRVVHFRLCMSLVSQFSCLCTTRLYRFYAECLPHQTYLEIPHTERVLQQPVKRDCPVWYSPSTLFRWGVRGRVSVRGTIGAGAIDETGEGGVAGQALDARCRAH